MACEDLQKAVELKTQHFVGQLQQKSAELSADIQQRAQQISPDIDTNGPDAWVGIDFDIEWERAEFSLDLPEVKMVDQRWSLDLPQVTMKNKDIIFHTPSMRMKTVQVGSKPETVCKMTTRDVGFGIKIDVPECTVRWTPIYIDVPEPFPQEQRIVIGIPEFRIDRTEFVLGVPEIAMRTQKFALDLPKFVVKNISVEAKKAQEQGETLSQEATIRSARLKEEFRSTAQLELGHDVTALFDCYRQDLMTNKNDALHRFGDGINLLQTSITSMTAAKVPDENENLAGAKAALVDLIARRDEFAADIERKFVELGAQQKQFFDKLVA